VTSGAPVKPARWCSVLWRLAAGSHLHEAWFKPRERLNEVALGGQCVQGQVEGVGFEVAAPLILALLRTLGPGERLCFV